MGQEAETQTDLKCIVCDAIKNKDISVINAIENEKQLRYIQKVAGLQISKRDSEISFQSGLIGAYGIDLAIAPIGVSIVLVGVISFIQMFTTQNFKIFLVSIIFYILLVILGSAIVLHGIQISKTIDMYKKDLGIIKKETEFLHYIVLNTEEKLLNKT